MKQSIVKITSNITDKYIDIKPSNSSDIISYGDGNSFPNELLEYVSSSPTSMSCIEKRVAFIVGNGISNSDVSYTNRNFDDIGEIILDAAYSLALFDGVYYRISYNLNGTPSIEVLPYETVRRAKEGGFVVNPDWGKKNFSKKNNVYIPEFDRNKPIRDKIAEIIELGDNYVGEIYYSFRKKPGQYYYSIPYYYSGIEDIKSDAAIIALENSNIEQGFNVDFILYTFGKFDDTIKGEDGLTDLERFRRDLKEFRQPGSKKIMHIECETKDTMPVVTPVPLKDVIDAIDRARDRIPRAVCRHMGVPPVLVGLPNPEGLGNTQALANYIKLFNFQIKKEQIRLKKDIKYLLDIDIDIQQVNILDYIEPQLLEVLTIEEKRKLIGYGN